MENKALININKIPELLKHNYTFIDLRSVEQFTKVHLQKFINIPYEVFLQAPPKLPPNIPIYLLCYSGKRSLDLATKLNQNGYQAYSFNGGFYAIEHPINNNLY